VRSEQRGARSERASTTHLLASMLVRCPFDAFPMEARVLLCFRATESGMLRRCCPCPTLDDTIAPLRLILTSVTVCLRSSDRVDSTLAFRTSIEKSAVQRSGAVGASEPCTPQRRQRHRHAHHSA